MARHQGLAGRSTPAAEVLYNNRPTADAREKSSAKGFLIGGLVVVGIGLLMQWWYGPIWQGSNNAIADPPLFIALIGAVVAGKGLLGLRKSKAKAL